MVERSLVLTFREPCQVISWAPFHGGFRTAVSHVLIHQVSRLHNTGLAERLVKQPSNRIGLRGTVVGMGTTADVRSKAVAERNGQDLTVHAIAVVEAGPADSNEATDSPGLPSADASICLVLVVNRRLTHEMMLEAMAIGVEAKSKLIPYRSDPVIFSRRPDHVAVVALEDQQRRYEGSQTTFKDLMASACAESLYSSLRARS